jgi:hypothetical protein
MSIEHFSHVGHPPTNDTQDTEHKLIVVYFFFVMLSHQHNSFTCFTVIIRKDQADD